MITITIPIHKMRRADFFLRRCLDSIIEQTFDDFDVVITDNSDDNELWNIIKTYGMRIHYYKNPKKGMAPNTNEAIKHARGDLIKIMYMDDYFSDKTSLQALFDAFKGNWLICGTDNNAYPFWTDNIETGNNKLGSPSALMMINKMPSFFDENMTWLLDCDYYKRLYSRYGEPDILEGVYVNMGVGPHQVTHLLSREEKVMEEDYMKKKYAKTS